MIDATVRKDRLLFNGAPRTSGTPKVQNNHVLGLKKRIGLCKCETGGLSWESWMKK